MNHERLEERAIAESLHVLESRVEAWLALYQMPKLAHFLKTYLRIGTPREGLVWLSMRQSHGYAIPLGPMVQVPTNLQTWKDFLEVLNQLQPLEQLPTALSRGYAAGFLIGMMVGDSSKSKHANWHRHLGLALSMKYSTNLALGNFTSLCARSLGLKMDRKKDRPRKHPKPHGFYEWSSESSPLLDWIMNVGLGLRDDQVTTYDSIEANWMLKAPRDFRLGVLNGLAESDGSVSIASQAIELWVEPSWYFVKDLLLTFGMRSFKSRQAVSMSKSQAIAAARLPIFSPHIGTIRFERAELLGSAQKFVREERYPDWLREEIAALAREGFSISGIIESIARRRRILVSFEAAQRWAKKATEKQSAANAAQNIEKLQ